LGKTKGAYMQQIVLGRTNRKVSAISLGTWSHGGANIVKGASVGWANQKDEDSRNVLIQAWKSGINHWDTADVYGSGRSEKIIGSVWGAVPRDEIFLATKVGWDMGSYPHYYHPEHMRNQLKTSLKNLKTEVIDLYYMHHCHFGKQGEFFDEALEMMHRFRDEGYIQFIGISDWNLHNIMTYIDRANPDVVQPYRNVMDDKYEQSGLREWIDNYNAGVCFFSPLKHGLLTGKYQKPVVFPSGDFRSNIADFRKPEIIKRMQKIRKLLEERFSDHTHPVMHGIVDALLTNTPTGCVLLGQRNLSQVSAAATLGQSLSQEDAKWVKALYGTGNYRDSLL